MCNNFNVCIKYILDHEGGLVDHEHDRGGITNYGITLPTLQRVRPGATIDNIRNLKQYEAEKIYFDLYWKACKCDNMLLPVALLVFDTAVNMGVNRASKILQRTVNAYQDGIIGAKTLAKLNRRDPRKVVLEYSKIRKDVFISIVMNNDTQFVFLYGWLNRVMDTLGVCLHYFKKGEI